jgi:uncharacterized protein
MVMGVLSDGAVLTAPTVPSRVVTGEHVIEAFRLATADGESLEAEWAEPHDHDQLAAVVVLAHPHPAHGGTMRSLVTSELFGSLPDVGMAVLRFNFRGVEGSTGTHSGGPDERADVVAAVAEATRRRPDALLVLSGWSFGGDVSLAVDHPAIAAWFTVAPTLRILEPSLLVAAHDPRAKHLAVPEHDEFNPPASCREKVEGWVATTVEEVAGADHYLVGRTARLVASLTAMVEELRAAR